MLTDVHLTKDTSTYVAQRRGGGRERCGGKKRGERQGRKRGERQGIERERERERER